MAKRFISLLLLCLFIVFVFSNCGGTILETQPPTDKSPYYTVLADEHLQPTHKEAILAALDDWALKTNYTLKYKLDFLDISTQPKDTSLRHTIKIYVSDPGPGYAGWTYWSAGNASAYVLVAPSVDGETFRLIMMHEFGHAFNLGFDNDPHYKGPYKSVMHPALGGATEVSCPEITAFCNEYGCQTDCTNIPLETNVFLSSDDTTNHEHTAVSVN